MYSGYEQRRGIPSLFTLLTFASCICIAIPVNGQPFQPSSLASAEGLREAIAVAGFFQGGKSHNKCVIYGVSKDSGEGVCNLSGRTERISHHSTDPASLLQHHCHPNHCPDHLTNFKTF
ncbi:hypothetical protein NGA_0547800 [Nannochloropsis gaditana CCMP526]|uniref:uncharacterized protein n=1 Tax=Nannochloropsis gaditana (strain CCMP526) TaxID=1093141 RepID=UPI00029F639D|nr:hypothetical protein NGA_0547800 [Nannochloropsis gaditana CCMP526]EKU20408.1 hypothetical protein NGA_0547800 [Nannochloropsis gaditana CCMP526]|eukprot:XP_005855965.1 hypothetical protein NGA_0547800 [Nannochloropsis gaditana CCMP526]